jgi:polar amino acid transport system substrate-binding protein
VFSSVDNVFKISAEEAILRTAYQRLGIEITIIGMPAKRALRSSNTGLTDGEAARIAAVEQEYPNLIRIAVPIRVDPMHLYVRAGNEFAVNGWDSIPDGYILGYRRGVMFAEYAVARYNLRSSSNNSENVLFEQLNKDRIDVVLASPGGAEKMIKDLQLDNIIQLNPPVYISYLYHFLNKKHADLVPEITKVLQDMEKNGLIQELNEQFTNNKM